MLCCCLDVSYQEILEKNLRVMDTAAISLCRDNGIPIVVFKLMEPGNLRRVVAGEARRLDRQRA